VAAKTALQEGVRVTFRKVSYTFMKIGTHVQLTNESFEGKYVLSATRYKTWFLSQNIWIYQV